MNISNKNFTSIELMRDQLARKVPQNQKQNDEKAQKVSFEQILLHKQEQAEIKRLKFSKHANERLISRNIDLSKEQLTRLENGTNRAREKGIKESLIMVDNLAFIVNVKNNTVITAVDETEGNIFTNIDGAVIG